MFFFVFCLKTNSFSQSISYGVVGGVNISNTKVIVDHNGREFENKYDNRVSFYIGGNIEFPFKLRNKDLLLNVELIYSEQGHSLKGGSETYIYELNQLNLPVRIKSKLFNNFYFGIGGYIGYILQVKGNLYGNKIDEFDLDFGVLSSVEYKLFGDLNIELKYLLGLSDVLNREFKNGEYKHNKYSRVFQVGLNYKL